MDSLPVRSVVIGDIPALVIENQWATACILLQGAQVVQFQPHDAAPLLWHNPEAEFQLGKAVRVGIPICWPWFGALDKNPQAVQTSFPLEAAPAHGLARTELWTPVSWSTDDEGCTVSLQLQSLPDDFPLIPTLTVQVGKSLVVALTTVNCSEQSVSYSQALHSYFPTDDIAQTQVNGLDQCRYLDALDDWKLKTQQGEVQFSEETDRIYLGSPEHLSISLPGQTPSIELDTSGSASTVVWNPWLEKARWLSQFDDSAYKTMLCVETATADADAITLEPSQAHTLKLSISS